VATQNRNPTSDEAASGTLSGSAGTRYTLVDDYPDANGADVLSFGTTTAQITFGFSAFSIPTGSTSISVQVLYYDGEAANGANNCGGRLKVGGSYYNAATHNPSGTTYTSRTDNWATNPQTAAAWTVDQVNGIGANALQAFGIGSTDSNPAFRVSSVQLQVTYTAPVTRTAGIATAATAQTSALSGSVAVTADIASAASAQASAMTGTVGSSVTADMATASSAQIAAMSGSVQVAASVLTQASVQAALMAASVVVAAGMTTGTQSQASALVGSVVVAGHGATLATTQQASLAGAAFVTGAVATAATTQVSAMTGGGVAARAASITTIATQQLSAMVASTGIVGDMATQPVGQVSAMSGGRPVVLEVRRPEMPSRSSYERINPKRGFVRWRRLRR
jgi:hypothetical protein